jgi:serine/threonine protein kinase
VASGQELLGEFRTVRLIRAGQTCQVWEALRGRERVALKILQPEVRGDREEINYLKHEYEVGRDLHHPNVAEIYGFHIERSLPFLAMEFHPGMNVKMLIRGGMESYGFLVPEIIMTAGRGLHYFHEQGWVHRDIKPDNFLVAESGEAKLIDFALAVRIRTGFARLFSGKTRVAGTRSYMAPEQIRGKTLDPRTDVYAFGCLLFELVTGRLPFTGTTPEELLRKHLHNAIPSAMAYNKNVTQEFNDLVYSMMNKQPEERPESIEEVLQRFHGMRVFRMMPKRPDGKPAGA